jgi:hypothetical protein
VIGTGLPGHGATVQAHVNLVGAHLEVQTHLTWAALRDVLDNVIVLWYSHGKFVPLIGFHAETMASQPKKRLSKSLNTSATTWWNGEP